MNESASQRPRTIVLGEATQPPLKFAFWKVRPDIVLDNIARYVAETSEHVVCVEVPGDYRHHLDSEFAAGAGPDVFYAQRAEASLWDATGNSAPIDEAAPAIAPLLARMDRRMVDGARNRSGQLLGLTYYNGGPFGLFVHERAAHLLDLDRLTDWRDVLDQLRRAKRDGHSVHPFLPRWHRAQTGLVWSLLCHIASEGVFDFERPDAGQALQAALDFFRSLVDEDLVPPASLADEGDDPALQRWISDRHILTFTMDYLAADATQRAGRPLNIIAPRLPGRTGTPLMPGHALLCLRAGIEEPRLARAQRLLAYLGGGAANEAPNVHARWLSECLFAVPYPELDNRPGIRADMERAFPAAVAKVCVERLIAARQAAVVSAPTHAPWFLEWSGFCDTQVRQWLLRAGAKPAGTLAETLLERWFDLAKSG